MTRGNVQTGDGVMIGGFLVQGDRPKKVVLRAMGPSLAQMGLANALADPVLELHEADGTVITNDDWKASQQTEIEALNLAPPSEKESAIIVSLPPGAHTAIVRGQSNGVGVGLVEVYDADPSNSGILANVSTRGKVGAGDNVLIGGFILEGASGSAEIAVRGIGPGLASFGISNPVPDPLLSLYDANGAIASSNDNWQDDATSAAKLVAAGLAPANRLEAALLVRLAPGGYTATFGDNTGMAGIGLLEIYNLH